MATVKAKKDVQTQYQVAAERLVRSFAKSVADLNKTAEGFATLPDTLTDLSEQIEDKKIELDSLSKLKETKEREAAAELDLQIKENKDLKLTQLMKEKGYVPITAAELNELRSDLAQAIDAKDSEIEKAVTEAKRSAAISHNAEIAILKKDTEVAHAKLEATVEQQTQKIESLMNENARLEHFIEAEREAAIKRAQADSQRSAANIYTNSK